MIYTIFIFFRIHIPKMDSFPVLFSHPTQPPVRLSARHGSQVIRMTGFPVLLGSQVIKMVRLPVLTCSPVIKMVRVPVFPGSQVIKLLRFPVFPGAQAVKLVSFPIFPGSPAINMLFSNICRFSDFQSGSKPKKKFTPCRAT